MKIYKIANHKEAKLFDFIGNSRGVVERIAKDFVERYFNSTNKTPTVGDIILELIRNSSEAKNMQQKDLRAIASSVLSSFTNTLAT